MGDSPAFSLLGVRYDGRMKAVLVLAATCLLAACGQGDNEPGPGGVTVGEAKALDEAAEMLEQRRMPPEAVQPTAAPTPAEAPQGS